MQNILCCRMFRHQQQEQGFLCVHKRKVYTQGENSLWRCLYASGRHFPPDSSFFTFLLVNKKFKAMNLPLPSALAELNFFFSLFLSFSVSYLVTLLNFSNFLSFYQYMLIVENTGFISTVFAGMTHPSPTPLIHPFYFNYFVRFLCFTFHFLYIPSACLPLNVPINQCETVWLIR